MRDKKKKKKMKVKSGGGKREKRLKQSKVEINVLMNFINDRD